MRLSASIGDPIMLLRRAKQSGTYLTKGLTAKLWNRSEKYDLYPITLKSILEKKEKIWKKSHRTTKNTVTPPFS